MNNLILNSLKPREKQYEINDDGLIIRVYPSGAKVFCYREMVNGKRKLTTIGKFPICSYAKARAYVDSMKLSKQKILSTFSEVYQSWLETKSDLTDKVKRAITCRMNKYIIPAVGQFPIQAIKSQFIYSALLEATGKSETIRKTLGYTNQVMNYAVALGLIDYNCCTQLIKAFRLSPSVAMASISYKEISELKPLIASMSDDSRDFFLCAFYTLLRPGELAKLRYSYIKDDVLVVPAEIMKQRKQHIIPISSQLASILTSRYRDTDGYIFPSSNSTTGHITHEALNKFLRNHGFRDRLVMHGIRSIGRTFFADNKVRFEVAEACLAHQEKSTVVRAYTRTDYLEERREVMQQWCDYVESQLK